MKIPFNHSLLLGPEEPGVVEALRSGALAGNGEKTRRCTELLQERLGCARVVMTPSCTDALEMAALLCDLKPGDEVIFPAFSFVTTVSAFVLRGATPVWCDIRPDTKNLDERLVEGLVTERTRAVLAVHYGGVGCEMAPLQDICRKHGLRLVEDAAQAIGCEQDGRPLGSFGDLATLSFHESKNIHCGEGGALIVNDPALGDRAELLRDKGTNRSLFERGRVDKYTWVELGSSFLMSELQAAFLLPQLERVEEVNERRRELWRRYRERLSTVLPEEALPGVPSHCSHNGHLFYVLCQDEPERRRLIRYLADRQITAVFHYQPLHRAPYWQGRYDDVTLPVTERVAASLLRLPMFFTLRDDQVDRVCDAVTAFFRGLP